MGTFDYMAIGVSALRAFKMGITVAGYNVANAQTDGFSKRRISLLAMPSVAVTHGQIGTGVDIASVTRDRDTFLDFSVRREYARTGSDTSRKEVLSALEPSLGDVQNPLLGGALSNLFDAFETLAVQPSDPAARANVVARAGSLASTFQNLDSQMDASQRSADQHVQDKVQRVNEILGQLKQMNVDVLSQEAGGAEASDLRDQRDTLVDELSQILAVRTVQQKNGQVNVFLESSGDPLLSSASVNPLQLTKDAGGFSRVGVNRAGQLVDISDATRSGQLGGYLKARDTDIAGYRTQLNTLAANVITEMNAIHQAGYDLDGTQGVALFQPDPPGANAAAAIHVNAVLVQDPRKLAAADAPNENSNNANVLRFIDLRTKNLAALGGLAIGDYASTLTGNVGRDVQASTTAAQAGQQLISSYESKRQSVSGVNLDEEASDIIKWQQAYQAAAQFLKTTNDLINTTLTALSS